MEENTSVTGNLVQPEKFNLMKWRNAKDAYALVYADYTIIEHKLSTTQVALERANKEIQRLSREQKKGITLDITEKEDSVNDEASRKISQLEDENKTLEIKVNQAVEAMKDAEARAYNENQTLENKVRKAEEDMKSAETRADNAEKTAKELQVAIDAALFTACQENDKNTERIRQETKNADQARERANQAEQARQEAENGRMQAEQARQEAENGRMQAEQARQEAENGRMQAEQARQEAENGRMQAEKARQEAENGRTQAEHTKDNILREKEEQEKILNMYNQLRDDEAISNSLQEEEKLNETERAAEQARQEAERAKYEAEERARELYAGMMAHRNAVAAQKQLAARKIAAVKRKMATQSKLGTRGKMF